MVNYDIDLQYHPEKINVVRNALSRKPEASMTMQLTQQKELLKEMMKMNLVVVQRSRVPCQLMAFYIQLTSLEKIKAPKSEDPQATEIQKASGNQTEYKHAYTY